ncbi:MAG: hypothetical protein VXX31_13470, partial [Planctomycetota bacterium]|nr:hypothetical protein [Planctomycetota bacterium]
PRVRRGEYLSRYLSDYGRGRPANESLACSPWIVLSLLTGMTVKESSTLFQSQADSPVGVMEIPNHNTAKCAGYSHLESAQITGTDGTDMPRRVI